MIADLFIKILNLSIGAVPIMAVLLILRLIFKKAVPRKVFYIAWALVFLRLMVPFSIESDLSFFNFMPRAEVVEENIGTSVVFIENSGITVDFPVLNHPSADNPNTDSPAMTEPDAESKKTSAPVVSVAKIDKNHIYGTIWIFGTAGLLLFGIIGYFAVLKKTKFESIPYTKNIRLSDFFKTPIVCGLFRPKIILPMNFDLEDDAKVKSVIAHECTHIRRGDNFWRLLASFTLYIHWFNPLVWICYDAFIRDMEVSCDEEVLGKSESDIRGEYAESLVSLSGSGTNPLYGGVLSFGESAIKERVKCIMNFKKATVFILIICVMAAVALGAIFLTNPSVPTETEQSVSYETFATENSKAVYSKENGLEIEVMIKNTDDKTIWLGPATYIYLTAEGGGETFAGVYGNGGVLMIPKGEEALFCDTIPVEKFHESVKDALPAGEYILQREVYFDEGLTPTGLYAEFCFELVAAAETIPAEQFYGRVMEGSHLGSFIPDQSNMPTEDVFDDPNQKKYCEDIIDGIIPETVEKFYVTFSPNDETSYREIEYFYMEEILFLLQNMELTVCEMKNPNTGGLMSVYFQTTAGNITIQNNGGFFTIAKKNDSVRYAFDAEPCASVFDDIESIARGVMSGEFDEGETNPQAGIPEGSEENNDGPAPVQIGEEHLIPYKTVTTATLFNNAEKIAVESFSEDALRELLKYENFENFMAEEETEMTALGMPLTSVDTIEFVRAEDGKKYNLALYENGFIFKGSAVPEGEQDTIWIVDETKWEEFKNIIADEFENAPEYIPYWFGLISPKRVEEVVVFGESGEYSYCQENDSFENFFTILKNINVSSVVRFEGNKLPETVSEDCIKLKIYFETGTVYDILAERDYITMVSSDVNYGLRYKLAEKTDAYDAVLDYAEGGPANPMTGKPVIYLYPENETEVYVNLDFDGKITYTYPAINDGWKVLAKPDGTLTNLVDGSTHYYLFWEGTAEPEWTYEKGFVVKGFETEKFLRENLAKMGLTPREYNDFITYWVPKMQENKYNLISFSGGEYSEIAKLTVYPEPDSVIRIHMMWKALDEPIEIEPQVLPTYERKGFTLVEWGGTELY